jgi:hypothetical protein
VAAGSARGFLLAQNVLQAAQRVVSPMLRR